MQRRSVDSLIDQFVSAVNRAVRQRIREEDIPVQLRRGGARFGLYYSWNIQRFRSVSWIEPLEQRLPAPFPPSYRSLVTRYIFPAFEVSSLVLLGNTGQALYSEMSSVLFRDKMISDGLVGNGYVQFARPSSGDYDPVCFDYNRPDARGELPIVQISYQQALLSQRPKILREVAPSFAAFVDRYLRQESLSRV